MDSREWIGRRTGKLTIIAFEGLRAFGRGRAAYFKFRCDCGSEFVGQKSNVWGRKKDCGCTARAVRTCPPGATKHPLYGIWNGMLNRCNNPTTKSYKDYGGRGIKVTPRWAVGEGGRTGFECFCADMPPRPPGGTIERVERQGHYEPGNCIWIPKGDQSKNRRGVRLVRIGGAVRTVPDWCTLTGVPYWTAIRRIARGWPPDRAVTETPRRTAT